MFAETKRVEIKMSDGAVKYRCLLRNVLIGVTLSKMRGKFKWCHCREPQIGPASLSVSVIKSA